MRAKTVSKLRFGRTIKKARMIWRFTQYILLKKRYPFTLNIKTNYRCNSKCKYCNFWTYPDISMTTKQIISLIDEASKHAFYINIYGGEPLIRDDIGKIIDHMYRKDFLFQTICTNGLLVKENIKHLRKLDLVVMSLDGPKEYNDSVRCKGHFDKVIEAIDILKENDVPVLINSTLTKHNLKHVRFLMDLCMEKGVRISFQLYRNLNDTDLSPDPQEFRETVKIINTYPQEIFPYPKELYHHRYLQYPDWGDHKCTSGKDFCSINPRGDMFQCEITSEDYDKRIFRKGAKDDYDNNVFRKSFLKAFNDLDLSRCVKCWTCDRAAISYIMNNKRELIKNVFFFFKRDSFLKRYVLYKKRNALLQRNKEGAKKKK